ncbi:MAG: haloalkane dehalogenase [Actinomycetota bacterium]|nr:haloalkane dehalogenase [Actinomycetota bacterium]
MTPSAADPYPRIPVPVLDTEMAYVDTGAGEPVVFLHGNPTSAYLWRNVLPLVAGDARCLAPDLVGMGRSGPSSTGAYTFDDHARHLDAWFDLLALDDVVLVLHDWGGGLGFDWARRNPDRVAGIAYMETFVGPLTWDEWPQEARGIFQGMRSDAGERLVLDRNVFVERILPASVLRGLGEEEMAAYRAPFAEPGEGRRPVLTWPRQIPIAEEGPADVVERVQAYADWLASSDVPKLFVNAEPGSILTGAARERCRRWPNQNEVTVRGAHFLPEDSPTEIGQAVDEFVRRVRDGEHAALLPG